MGWCGLFRRHGGTRTPGLARWIRPELTKQWLRNDTLASGFRSSYSHAVRILVRYRGVLANRWTWDPQESFTRLIEWYCSGERRLEVFSRDTWDGWNSWNPWTANRPVEGMMPEESPTTREKGSLKKDKEGKQERTEGSS